MRGTKTFPVGGLVPYVIKRSTNEKPLWNAIIPPISLVPLKQHSGAPAECLVKPGSRVKEGMLIGEAKEFLGANVHSPVPGTVREIRKIHLPYGEEVEAVIIELGGEFTQLGKIQENYSWKGLSKTNLLDLIKDAGIVGMGGGVFPTHAKLTLPRGKKADILIINGVESEPYISSDYALMVEKAKQIIEGIQIITSIIRPDKILIGITLETDTAVRAVEAAATAEGFDLDVVPVRTRYPQGDERQLIKALTGRCIAHGDLPIHSGVVSINVATAFAVYESVVLKKPMVERVISVAGGAVREPANLKVRIGTPIGQLFEECGGFTREPAKVIVGGPMMGHAIFDLYTPVVKGTSGILALTSREVKAARQTACLNCGRCVRSCPEGLNPMRLYKWIDHLSCGTAEEEGLFGCSECGCCAYICPAHIPLVQGLRMGKVIRLKEGKREKK
jgi:Na+-translocating ferredoxin:NAD+ oxidoreductase subunit C